MFNRLDKFMDRQAKPVLVVILLIAYMYGIAWAADTALSGLTADTAPTSDDLILTTNDPGGTPGSRKVTLENLPKAFDGDTQRSNMGLAIGTDVEAADSTIIKESELQTTVGDPGSDIFGVSEQAVREALDDLDAVINTKLANVVEDTTPQSGGDHDLNAHHLTDATGIDDDDCTGDQGKLWWDSTDNQWEGCNANSGTPVVLGSGSGYTDIDSFSGDSIDDDLLDDAVQGSQLVWQDVASASTPNIGSYKNIAFTGSTTITNIYISGSEPTADTWRRFKFNGSVQIDLTASGIEAVNKSTDYTPTAEEVIVLRYDTDDSQWHFDHAPDDIETLSSDGIVVNSSGTPYARSIAGGTGITVTNGDGTAGNPSIAITSAGVTAALAATVMKTDGWNISLGNDSDAITTGKKILKTVCVPFKHDLEEIGLCTDETSGSITIDVWIDEKGATTGLSEVADADSLFDTASEPVISDASSDNCVAVTSFDSGEDTDIPAGSCYVINVDSASTLTYANVAFKVTRKD